MTNTATAPTLTEPTPFYNPDLPDSEQPDFRDEPMRRLCFTCKPLEGAERDVIGLFTTGQRFDPTQAYELRCGHSTIDV